MKTDDPAEPVRCHFLPGVTDTSSPSVQELAAAAAVPPHIAVADLVVNDFVYYVDSKPAVLSGSAVAWEVRWSGEPGPGQAREVTVLVDGEGSVLVEPRGEWRDVTVVDDTPGGA